MTERLYYTDSYLRQFTAQVVSIDGRRVYLDRTAFYPASGGQPSDRGTLGGVAIDDIEEDERGIAHIVAAEPPTGAVDCEIDWVRRFDHMQQHSGQHLLSAVLAELFGIETVSFHLGSEVSTIDIAVATLSPAQVIATERRFHELVFEARPLGVAFADATDELSLRKASLRQGELRIVSIDGIDNSACGGTHVRSTLEIGSLQIRKLDKVRDTARVEFVCGLRAIRCARADLDLLTAAARVFSAAPSEVPGLAAAALERAATAEKAARKFALEAATREGKELWRQSEAAADGLRRVVRKSRIDEESRALATAFAAESRAVIILVCDDPPSLLMAASKDAGIHAGNLVKAAVTECGGRGGGSPALGQGSVPDHASLERVVTTLNPRS